MNQDLYVVFRNIEGHLSLKPDDVAHCRIDSKETFLYLVFLNGYLERIYPDPTTLLEKGDPLFARGRMLKSHLKALIKKEFNSLGQTKDDFHHLWRVFSAVFSVNDRDFSSLNKKYRSKITRDYQNTSSEKPRNYFVYLGNTPGQYSFQHEEFWYSVPKNRYF